LHRRLLLYTCIATYASVARRTPSRTISNTVGNWVVVVDMTTGLTGGDREDWDAIQNFKTHDTDVGRLPTKDREDWEAIRNPRSERRPPADWVGEHRERARHRIPSELRMHRRERRRRRRRKKEKKKEKKSKGSRISNLMRRRRVVKEQLDTAFDDFVGRKR